MTRRTFYRSLVWLPIVLPLIVVAVMRITGPVPGPLRGPFGVLASSLVYGGLPYIALAIWATLWLDRRSDREIRRLALRAPLLMLAAYTPFAFLLGALSGRMLVVGGSLWALGALWILVLGYIYVAVVLAIRELGSRKGWLIAEG
jgi:hypothetical protein